jgi:plastocyanin
MPESSRALSLIASLLLAGACPVAAGTIVGTIRAQGADESANSDGGGGAYTSRRFKFLEKVDYEAMRDFVVSIDRVSAPASPDAPPVTTITQRDGMFVPHVLPIVAGSIVEWPNADDIFHNVFSMSEICSFDLGLYKRGHDAKRVLFPLPGRVDVFCSIHTRMSCIVLVLPNPWFAVSDSRNRYEIRHVPAGTYRLRAWHERLPAQFKEVVVPEHGEVAIDFILGLGVLPQP